MDYEYWVIPAPNRLEATKTAKSVVERLASGMTEIINDLAVEGWEYMRSETLSVLDKPSRFSKPVEQIETILIFRRVIDAENQRQDVVHAYNIEPVEPEPQEDLVEYEIGEFDDNAPSTTEAEVEDVGVEVADPENPLIKNASNFKETRDTPDAPEEIEADENAEPNTPKMPQRDPRFLSPEDDEAYELPKLGGVRRE